MDLVTPDIGLIFWTTVSFAILYFILAKFAWKPILGAVNEREKSIKDALSAAEKAKEEMVNLKADNEKILNEAKLQRELLLKEAREIKSKIISDAENEATEKANKLIESAKTAIFKDCIKWIQKSDLKLANFGQSELKGEEDEIISEILEELESKDENLMLEIKAAFFTDTDRLLYGDKKLISQYDGYSKLDDKEKAKNQKTGILKSFVAFSNHLGGKIVIGIDDPDHNVVGIDNSDLMLKKYDSLDAYKRSISQIIDEHVTGNLPYTIDPVKHQNKTVIIIKVKPIPLSDLNKKGLVKLNDIPYYRHSGPSNKEINFNNYDHVIMAIKTDRENFVNNS